MKFSLLAMSAIALAATAASATTITLSPLISLGYASNANPYSESGFIFSNSYNTTDAIFAWGSIYADFSFDPGGATLSNNYYSTTTTLTKIDGGKFNFVAIDLGDVYNNYYNAQGGDILFAFTDALGTTYQTVTIDGVPGAQTFSFNRTGLLSVSYLPQTTFSKVIQVDNVVVSATVPEPASWALLIAGFGLVGSTLRARRRQTA